MRMFVLSLAGCFLFLAACASPSQSFDPEDPAVVAAIESLMAAAIQAAGDVDPVKVLESMGGGEEFSLVTSDVMLVGLQKVQEAFKDTYDGLERQDHTVFETRVRLLSLPLRSWLSAASEAARGAQIIHPVGLLPGESVAFATKVAAGGRLAEDGPAQVQVVDDGAGTQVEMLLDELHQGVVSIHLPKSDAIRPRRIAVKAA